MRVIDEAYAWQCLRDAASAESERRQQVADGPAIVFETNGTWSSDESVDATARRLLDALAPVAMAGERFVVGQLGQSLDGRIATNSGHSHYVTGEESRVHLHRLRALVDAVLVGAGTVDADDPQLTVRHVDGRNPVRVVLDPNTRVPASRKVFTDPAALTLHLCAQGHGARGASHVEWLAVECGSQGVEPHALLDALAARGLGRVLVEGGGRTVSRFLQAGALDRLHVVVAPMLIGSGLAAVTLPEIDTLAHALRPSCRHVPMGTDILFDLDLRDTTRAQGAG